MISDRNKKENQIYDNTKDKKAFEILAATGEIHRELYRMSRAEEGKQDRETLEYKNKLTKWLKDNGVEEDEISDIENYVSISYNRMLIHTVLFL